MLFVCVVGIMVFIYCVSALFKHNIDLKRDDKIREVVTNMFLDQPKEIRYKYLLITLNVLQDSLPLLEQNARTIEQFAEVDRIKRNIKILLEEIKKIEQEKQ